MIPLRDHLPTRVVPVVNYAIIIVNLVVFAVELWLVANGVSIDAWAQRWALVPARFLADPVGNGPTLLTHMFLHGGLAHVGGNMLYLWIFGDNVEDVLGHARYAIFYLLSGLCAAFAQIAASSSSELPMLGASGAIAGVLAAYLLLYPRSPITVVNPIPLLWLFWGLFLWFPAWLVIALFFIATVINVLHPTTTTGIAFVAHLGGFGAGLLFLPLLRVRSKVESSPWFRWRPPPRPNGRASRR